MDDRLNPADLLKKWLAEHEVRIRELQCVSAYLGARVERLETLGSMSRSDAAPADPKGSSPFIGVNEAAALLSVTPMAMRCRLRRREIPAGVVVKIGRMIRFDREKFLQWIRQKAVHPPSS